MGQGSSPDLLILSSPFCTAISRIGLLSRKLIKRQ